MALAGEKVFDKKLPGEEGKASWEVNKCPKAAQGTEVCECCACFVRAGTPRATGLALPGCRACWLWMGGHVLPGDDLHWPGKAPLLRAEKRENEEFLELWEPTCESNPGAGWPQLLCALFFRQHVGWGGGRLLREACKVQMAITAKCSLPGITFSVSWLCCSGFS